MGEWVVMGECELQRVEVLKSILTGRSTVGAVASVLPLSPRQVHLGARRCLAY
jgi:hypothetical protein